MNDQLGKQKNSNIRLSVIVPVYNVRDYLDDCLYSLAEQKVQNVEFIIIDDGSTDGSSEICDKWGKLDKRFVIIHQENKGTLIARKIGIIRSNGERIIFLDGDDMLAKDALHDVLQLVKKSNAEIIQYSISIINCKNKKILDPYKNLNIKFENNLDIAKAMYDEKIIRWSLIFKIYNSVLLKKSIEKMPSEKFIYAEDMFHQFLIVFYTKSFQSFKTRPLYIYRHGIGISTKQQDMRTFIKHLSFKNIILKLNLFLDQENASQEWHNYLKSIKLHLYERLIYCLANIAKEDFPKAFKLFYEKYNIVEFLPWIEKYFNERRNEILFTYANLEQYIKVTKKINILDIKNKTVGIFDHRYYNSDIDRVISLQLKIFTKIGYKIIIFTEHINEHYEYDITNNIIIIKVPVLYSQKRAEILLNSIRKYNISIFCFHVTDSSSLIFDLIFSRETCIPTIVTAHCPTNHFMAVNKLYPNDTIQIYQLASTLVTLSSIEEQFYKLCGVNARFVPNPVEDIEHTNVIPVVERKPTVLWFGRLENSQKNYKEALKILKFVINKKNNVVCYFIGSGNIKDNIYVKMFINCFRLKKNIIFIPYIKNVGTLYKKASVLLVTSSFESFPMTIVEGKLHGLPLVTYNLPAIELLHDGKGYLSVERHNIQKAAEAVLKILNDKKLAESLSKEARESIEPYILFDQVKAWSQILNDPSKQYTAFAEKDTNRISLFWNDVLDMYREGHTLRNTMRNQFSYIKIILKKYDKRFLTYFFPPESKRRYIAVILYHAIKRYIKK